MLTLPTVNLQAYKRTRNLQMSKTIIQFKEIYFALLKKNKKQKQKNNNNKKKTGKQTQKNKTKKQKQIETKQKQFKTNKLRLLNGKCSFT